MADYGEVVALFIQTAVNIPVISTRINVNSIQQSENAKKVDGFKVAFAIDLLYSTHLKSHSLPCLDSLD